MKKRLAAMFLCLALMLALAAPAAQADEIVFFTAMGESILPLTEATMPFISGSNIYIPTSIFTGTVRKVLNVSSTYNNAERLVILYRGSQSLWFYLDEEHAHDHEDNVYYPGAVVRGGEVFVSATLVARFFDLTYTVTQVPHGYMVWMRQPGHPLSEERFADAASYSMENRYAAYLKEKETKPPKVEQPEDPVMDGKTICMAFAGNEETERLLSMVESTGKQAAVFFAPEEMSLRHGLLRRMAAQGHSIGLLLDAAVETPVLQQAEQANRALEEATCGRTRLVRLENPTEEAEQALRSSGYCPVSFEMESPALRTAAQAEALVQRISRRSGNVKVWLGQEAGVAGVSAFLRSVEDAEGRCRALTETS